MALKKAIVLITGGNTGLGLETVKALGRSGRPYEILIGSRDLKKADAAVSALKSEFSQSNATFSTLQIDLTSDESIKKARDQVISKFGKLDVLINNAGAGFDAKIQTGSMSLREAWNVSWDTNVSGTMVMTSEFAPLLLDSSDPRIIFLTSGTSPLAETERFDLPHLRRINASPEAGWPKPKEINPITSYRSTKTGLNMMMREWHRILLKDGVKVWAISPGFLATGLNDLGADLMKKMGAQDPSVGGEFIKDVVEGKRDQDVGKVIRATDNQPW